MPKKPPPSPKGAVARPGLKGPKGAQPRRKQGRKRDAKSTPPPAASAPAPDARDPATKPENSLVVQRLIEKAEQVRALSGMGLTDAEIAIVVGISPEELFQYTDTIGPWLVEGRAKAKAQVRRALYSQAVLGSYQHIAFWEQVVLGTRIGSGRFGDKPGDSSATTDPGDSGARAVLSDDDIMGRIRMLRDKYLATVDQQEADRVASLPNADVIETTSTSTTGDPA